MSLSQKLPSLPAWALACLILPAVAGAAEPQHRAATSFSYSAPARLAIGGVNTGDVDALHTDFSYQLRLRSSETYSWGVGAGWERIGFGLPVGVPLPNTLNALRLTFQNEWKFADDWSVRVAAQPGLYSDLADVDGGDFNSPFTAALAYAANDRLTWVLALNADLRRDVPIIGGVGVRWQMAEDWTLSLLLPKPTVDYRVSDRVTLFAGGELVGGAFRVGEDFGNRVGRPGLNDTMVSYREIRVGAGVRARLSDRLSLVAEGGWMIDRRFVFEEADLQLNGSGAPYFGLSLNASF